MKTVNFIYDSKLHADTVGQYIWNSGILDNDTTLNFIDISQDPKLPGKIKSEMGVFELPALVLQNGSSIYKTIDRIDQKSESELTDTITKFQASSGSAPTGVFYTIQKVGIVPWWVWLLLAALILTSIFIYKKYG